MDTQVLDLIKIVVTGLIGAVITPFVAQLLIPLSRKRFGLNSIPSADSTPSDGTAPSEDSMPASESPQPASESPQPASKPPRPPYKPPRGLLAVIGLVIFGLVAYFLIKPTFLSPCPLFASISVPITSPAEGSRVPTVEKLVQGTACHIPADKELWLLVVARGVTGYYPQNGPIIVSSDGKWSASAILGGKGSVDVGREFVLYTALVDQEGSAAIQNYFKSAPNFKPLYPLSAGIELINQVHVVRE